MMRPLVDIASGRQTPLNAQHQRLPDTGGVSNVTLMVCRAALTAACSSRSLLARFKPLRQPTRKGVNRMHRPDQPPAPPARAAPTSRWRRRVFYYTGGLALIVIGALIGLMGLIKVQGVIIPLNIELREGCLADPSLVPPRASCPHEAEAILRYPDGRTEVIRGTPEKVQRRVAVATEPLIAAERWRGLGYLLVAMLLVESGIAAIVWQLVRRGRWRFRRFARPGGEATSSPAG